MRNIQKIALCASLVLTVSGLEAVSAHAPRPAFPILLGKNLRRQQEAQLIARIRNVQVVQLTHHITHIHALLITEHSFAGNPHSFLVRTGRAQLVTEAIVNRNEDRTKLLDELLSEKRPPAPALALVK